MSDLTLSRLRATAVFAAPLVVFLGFVTLPYVTDSTPEGFASAALAEPLRWGWGNLIVTVGLLLLTLAAFSIRTYLRDAGEDRWSPFAIPMILFGHGLIAFVLGADMLARIGLADGGLALETALADTAWLAAIETVGGLLMPLGWLALAIGVATAKVMTRAEVGVVFFGWLVALVGMMTVFGWSGFVFSIGLFVMLAPIGRDLWVDAEFVEHTPVATPRLEFRAAAHH